MGTTPPNYQKQRTRTSLLLICVVFSHISNISKTKTGFGSM
jgi:hypothetical protein